MEGGIAILLLLLLVVGIAAAAFGLSALGGGLSLKRRSGSKQDAEERDQPRPVHTQPTTVYQEKTRFVGAENELERAEPERSDQR